MDPITGDTEGGTLVTLKGTNFGLVEGGTAPYANPRIDFGGVELSPAASGFDADDLDYLTFILPESYGAKDVKVVVGNDQESNTILFEYREPHVDRIVTMEGDSDKVMVLQILGTNFYTVGSVLVNGQRIYVSAWDHREIWAEFESEATSGDLVVVVGSRQSDEVEFVYFSPVILSYPNGLSEIDCALGCSFFDLDGDLEQVQAVNKYTISESESVDELMFIEEGTAQVGTAGGAKLTLIGKYFGNNPTVTVGGNNCVLAEDGLDNPRDRTDLEITNEANNEVKQELRCIVAPGQGLHKQIVVTRGSVYSNPKYIDYAAPSILWPDGPVTSPTQGKTVSYTGMNLGFNGSIWVGEREATFTTITDHEEVTFEIPAGEGNELDIKLIVEEQSSDFKQFDYDAPVITSVSPSKLATSGGEVIITGSSFGTQDLSQYHDILIGKPDRNPPLPYVECKVCLCAGDYPCMRHIDGECLSLEISDSSGSLLECPLLSSLCLPNDEAHTHDYIQCIAGELQGSQLQVVANISDQINLNKITIDSYPPTVDSIYPSSGSTMGGYNVTVYGENFGQFGLDWLIKFEEAAGFYGEGDITITSDDIIYWTHNEISFFMPEGQG